MRRLSAARENQLGCQILTLPQMAARLAGGFIVPATSQQLDEAVGGALGEGSLGELEKLRLLPGTTRAVSATLRRLWDADYSIARNSTKTPILASLAIIEQRVRNQLSSGALSPLDLRDAAVARAHHAGLVLGSVELDAIPYVAPIWRPLIVEVARHIDCTWKSPATVEDSAWFLGTILQGASDERPLVSLESHLNPRAEVIEALRWARELIVGESVKPGDIAIAATSTREWDDHFYVLAATANFPIHFTHGLPALASWNGQACAALADILVNGINQVRMRRLLDQVGRRCFALKDLPKDWAIGLSPEAALLTIDHWTRALRSASLKRQDNVEIAPIVIPILHLLAGGVASVKEAGTALLPTAAQELWVEALSHAPPAALEYSLRAIRVLDERDPGASVVWCPASQLAGAPRPWTRLIGMSSRSWPRFDVPDPLFPNTHGDYQLETIREADSRWFGVLTRAARAGCVLSQSRRNAQGGLLAPSPLLPRGNRTRFHNRLHIPRHAFSLSDRLLARPDEAAEFDQISSATTGWKNWQRPEITASDGLIDLKNARVAAALSRPQSATSLVRLLRNPIVFVWRYALGWRYVMQEDEPLSLNPRDFGELVHELLRHTVDFLEPQPGYALATRDEVSGSLRRASRAIADEWPLARATPPKLLWGQTVRHATRLAFAALTMDRRMKAGSKSWTEVPFGINDQDGIRNAPWDLAKRVEIPGTGLTVTGAIDRLDLSPNGEVVRVSDYKTGMPFPQAGDTGVQAGRELQRVIYALAASQLLPGPPEVDSRLIYLSADEPQIYSLQDIDHAITRLSSVVQAARDAVLAGKCLPGPDSQASIDDYRIAFPAAPWYFDLKREAIEKAFPGLVDFWDSP